MKIQAFVFLIVMLLLMGMANMEFLYHCPDFIKRFTRNEYITVWSLIVVYVLLMAANCYIGHMGNVFCKKIGWIKQ